MRTWRTRRIGRSEADRLVAGRPTGPRHTGLAELLSAASAPPTAPELSGERSAVAAFVRLRRDGARATPAGGRRRWVPLSTRAATVKVAALTAVLVAGGTAAVAKTGQLPGGAQQRAHSILAPLGVPAPPAGGHPGPTPTTGGPSPGRFSASPATGGGATEAAAALPLCRAWAAVYLDRQGNPRNPPPGQALGDRTMRALAAAAGGEGEIPGFCAGILAGDGDDRPAHPTPPGGATPPGSPHGTGPATHPAPNPHTQDDGTPDDRRSAGGDQRADPGGHPPAVPAAAARAPSA